MSPRIKGPQNVLVLQHARVEHPGVFSDFLREDGSQLLTVELDEGEQLPSSLDPFDLMIVMGGPQDVWQEDQHPWMRPEKEAIRKFVADMQRPYLGICLGHQLLADALGGKVKPARTPEVGVMTVEKTEAGRSDHASAGLPDPLTVLQWHGAEVVAAPPGGTVIACSAACPIQALEVNGRAYSLQYHFEVADDTVANWAVIPEYAKALEDVMGADAVSRLDGQVAEQLPQFNKNARTLYDNLKAIWAL